MDANGQVQFVIIDDDNFEQRLDNFLITKLKGVPKSMIYRIIRKGEVRVNKKRIRPDYKLQVSDSVRIPPVRVSSSSTLTPAVKLQKVSQLNTRILYEDESLIALNKPSRIAVHGGSGVDYGVIEALRALRPEQRFLELVHRLDKETSGVLLIAKKRSALKKLHEQLRLKTMQKQYIALVYGQWRGIKQVNEPLLKLSLPSNERIVIISAEGKNATTRFKLIKQYQDVALIEASPLTGRTHQIRVHCKSTGNAIVGDDKYADAKKNLQMKQNGVNRLFLHAKQLSFTHPVTEQRMLIEAPLDTELENVLSNLN